MAKTNLSDQLPFFLQTIDKNIRHIDYERVCEIAKNQKIYITGEGFEEKLKRFHGGETEDQFDQRLALSIMNVADLANSCIKPLNKASRTPASVQIEWTGKDDKYSKENAKKINDIARKFWGKKSVKKYLTDRVGSIDSIDPNSFLVVEFKESFDARDVRSEKPKPYPFEVSSEEAINFLYLNNELQWLVVRKEILKLEKLFFYRDTENVTATQIDTKTRKEFLRDNPDIITGFDFVNGAASLTQGKKYLFSTSEENEENRRYYIIEIFAHKIPFCPAQVFGCIPDPFTKNRTKIPVIYPAKCYFEDSIQTMSEFSITKRLHTFPKLWQYLPKCDAPDCYGGKLRNGKGECKTCKGTGTKTHSSSQDIIGIKMPDELKDIVNLDLMSTYKGPAIDLVKFQKEFGFEDIRRYAQSAVYNNEVGRRRVKTATETEIDAEAVNDTLKPYSDNWSDLFEFIYSCIAAINDLYSDSFSVDHQFPEDLQIQTFSEILDDLKKANDTGAPSHVKKALQNKLTRKIYIDKPNEILREETKSRYYPFNGKTESEIQFIIINGKTTKYASTLYSHFDLIFSEVEYDSKLKNTDFYQLDESLQRKLIEEKVKQYIDKIDEEAGKDVSSAFGSANLDTPVDVEAEAKAKLKGSVGGVQGIIEIVTAISEKKMSIESGVSALQIIYGYDEETAKRLIGNPEPAPITPPAV